MHITVFGCGYVGLVTAAGLAKLGHTVTAVDKDRVKIDRLNNGEIPIFEESLEEIISFNAKENRLYFTANAEEGVKKSQVIFIAVGTPSREDGAADLRQVEDVAREVADYIEDYKVIVNKSTVPVGTGKWVREIIQNSLKSPVEFGVVSNPEFLREGSAVRDFMQPDRVVIGTDSLKAEQIMREVYQEFEQTEVPFIFTNLETAELIKYASNAFLATKIAFINDLARLCEVANADVPIVAKGMGLDSRIGSKFLNVGPGYGGSCFPKDTKALIEIAHSFGERLSIVEAVVAANEGQKQLMFEKIKGVVGELKGKTLAILGLAFKADTDDMRDSPAIPIINNLLAAGPVIKAHDPEALNEAVKIFGDRIHYCEKINETASGADALIIITEWHIYRQLDFLNLKRLMKKPVLIDLRNIYRPEELQKAGFRYEGVGRGIRKAASGFDNLQVNLGETVSITGHR